MAKRPVLVPRWGTDPSAQLVEPPERIRSLGFGVAERPPAPWFNWQFHAIAQWIDYMRGPQLTNWTRIAVESPLRRIAADTVTPAVPGNSVIRLIAIDRATANALWISFRGDGWMPWPGEPFGSFGTASAVVFNGARWVIGTLEGKLWWTAPANDLVHSALVDYTRNWTAAVFPSGTQAVNQLCARTDTGEVVAATDNAILYSSNGETFVAATVGSSIVGKVTGLCWTGSAWLAATTGGQLFRAVDAAGVWNLVAATLDDVHAGSAWWWWQLECDDAGTVLAYLSDYESPHGRYLSTDHGVTWSPLDAPAGPASTRRVRFLDGNWLLMSNSMPYLQQANRPDDASWSILPIPLPIGGTLPLDPNDAVKVEGAVIAVGPSHVLVSGRGTDLSGGDWSPSFGPSILSDAAYLQGRPIAAGSPGTGDALIWNGTQWAPATIGGGGEATSICGEPVYGTGPSAGDVLSYDGTKWKADPPILLSPLLFTLNPRSTAQLAIERTSAGGTPTLQTLTDPSGRPFLRMTAGANAGTFLFPFQDVGGNLIVAADHFIIRALLRFDPSGASAGYNGGIAFNAAIGGSSVTHYAVGRNGDGSSNWDSIVSSSNENHTVQNQLSTDASIDFAMLYIDVYLNTTTGYCNYTYCSNWGGPSASGFSQQRKTSLQSADGTAIGIFQNGLSGGVMDIAALEVWREARNW